MSPLAVSGALATVTLVSGAILYFGVPGTPFHGLQTGIFFPMDVDFADVRFMDHLIKCDSKEATAQVRLALRKVKADYPVERAEVQLTNYPSGYKFQVRYATYYGQRLSLGGEKIFRRGTQVGEPGIDAELKSRDEELERTIRDTLEAYFKSKGAHG